MASDIAQVASEDATEVKADAPQPKKRGPKPGSKRATGAAQQSKLGTARRFLVTMRHSPALRKSLIITAASKEEAEKKFLELNEQAARQSKAKDKNLNRWSQAMAENPPTWRMSVQELGVDVNDKGMPFDWPSHMPAVVVPVA